LFFARETKLKLSGIAGLLALALVGVQAQAPAGRDTVAQQAIPDAPTPQPVLPNLKSVAPGEGTTSSSGGDTQSAAGPGSPAAIPAGATAPAADAQGASAGETAPYVPPPGHTEEGIKTLMVHVDAVDVPFTVKDSKNKPVPGLDWRDVQVYENGLLQHIQLFTNEAIPL
jgi:hypothetical protein